MRALVNVLLPSIKVGDDIKYVDTKEFRRILQAIGLKPTDMPSDDAGDDFREYCLKRADPIFDRMPENTQEEKLKKQFSRDNIVYASDLPQSNSLFMVTAHTESEYRLRLLNPRIESLQEGCKDLVLKLKAYNAKNPSEPLKIIGKIDVLEHGLEEPTISGIVVESKWSATKQIAGRDVLIAIAGLVFFVTLTVINAFTPNGTVWHTVIDRLSTAMFTAMIVSALSIYHTYRNAVPVIQWTASYDER